MLIAKSTSFLLVLFFSQTIIVLFVNRPFAAASGPENSLPAMG